MHCVSYSYFKHNKYSLHVTSAPPSAPREHYRDCLVSLTRSYYSQQSTVVDLTGKRAVHLPSKLTRMPYLPRNNSHTITQIIRPSPLSICPIQEPITAHECHLPQQPSVNVEYHCPMSTKVSHHVQPNP